MALKDLVNKQINLNKEANDTIRQYFRECLDIVNDQNLFMLRKACMYISIVYLVMLVIAGLLFQTIHFSPVYLSPIPLLAIYFRINLYTMRHRGEIGTGQTAAICCTFYFFLGVILSLIDCYEAPAGQAIWLPVAVIALPMIFIDRIYKYGFEEFVVLTIMLVMSYFFKPHDFFIRDLYIAIASYIISVFSARIILEMRARETLAMKEVTRLSSLDKLTHVLNKGALIQRIDNYFAGKPQDEYAAMCVIDMDDFKYVNDNLGHTTGDLLLEKVGQLLKDNFRAYDIVGRYGGDEFVVLMPKMADPAILKMRCKALQMFISDINFGNKAPFTASMGAVITSGECDREEIFSIADNALYKSKIQGKNLCTVWEYKKNEDIRPIFLLLTTRKDELMGKMEGYNGEAIRFITAADDDEALNVISQTQNRVEVVVVEVDTEKEIGELSLKYLKTRENFERIPVLAVTNNEQANTVAKKQRADAVLAFDTPPAVYKKTIDKLIGR
jgi:diguanylate cyclase (GGDEF)-like protein